MRREKEVFVEERSRLPRAVLLRRERDRAAAAAAAQSAEPLPRCARAPGRRASPRSSASRASRWPSSQRAGGAAGVIAKVMVLTGGPGVGKTTALRALLDVLDARGVRYVSGGADRTRRQAHDRGDGPPRQHAPPPAGVHPANNDFGYNEHRPLPTSFVIVDEVSMLDILLAYRLVRAVAPEAHLLLVGDADQLPSVGPGSVLRDILSQRARAADAPDRAIPPGARERHRRHGARRQRRRDARAQVATQRATSSSCAQEDPLGRATADRGSRRPAPARALWLRPVARHSGAHADVSRAGGGRRAQRGVAGAAERATGGPSVAFGDHASCARATR